ncbi:MAG: TrkA family potassium uptake protein [Oscillospiraceae bacterium]
MNILIVGAGKVGSHLAQVLEGLGDEVSIIDDNGANLELLENFSGLRISGVAIDVDVLKSAGIENCDAVAAVTSNDNVNLMVAQIAQDIFHVPKVLCRVYDPARKTVFSQNFSIATICPTSITVDGVVSYLKFNVEPATLQFGATTAMFKQIPVSADMVGKRTSMVKQDDSYHIFGVLRADGNMDFYSADVLLEKGDSLILCELDK